MVLRPGDLFAWCDMPAPRYEPLWQCVGMVVGVYGVGYAIAATNPARHWPIILVGLLGKVLGPIGFLFAAVRGDLPWRFGLLNVANDLIWWAPFSLILYRTWRAFLAEEEAEPPPEIAEAMRAAVTQRGESLYDLSRQRPQLVVFLRHFGCTFCREAIADVQERAESIEAAGAGIVFVHMMDEGFAVDQFARYDAADVNRISDPDCNLYRAFGLGRGAAGQLLGPRVIWRGANSFFSRHGAGAVAGDVFRMPGACLVSQGRIVAQYPYRNAADRPDYVRLAGGEACAFGG